MIENIRKDDLLHIICSIIITSIFNLFFVWWIAVIITFVIGILKELIWDRLLKKGTPEWRDILSDIIGILIGLL